MIAMRINMLTSWGDVAILLIRNVWLMLIYAALTLLGNLWADPLFPDGKDCEANISLTRR
jgi:hypothetical protein